MTKFTHKKHDGHIVAFKINDFRQIDIYDLSKFEKHNEGYQYIFCCIDVFTRKVYCRAMKNKDHIITALIQLLKKIEFNHI